MLTETAIRAAKPREKSYKLFDGLGLYLEIAARGRKLWRLKYRHDGRENRLALGAHGRTSGQDRTLPRDAVPDTFRARQSSTRYPRGDLGGFWIAADGPTGAEISFAP